MTRLLALLGCLALAPALSFGQPPPPWEIPDPRWSGIVNLNGPWYNPFNDSGRPCFVRQRPGSRQALFVNENGSQAWGTVRGNEVFIPDWGDNGQGQQGILRGNRIVWPNGSYWTRQP